MSHDPNCDPVDYKKQLIALLPPGIAFTFEEGSNMDNFWLAFGDINSELACRVKNLFDEAIPLTTSELLTDWEETVGLPSECNLADPNFTPGTIDQRRALVMEKLKRATGMSIQSYIDLAAGIGFTIEIITYVPFQVGVSVVGDALTNPKSFAFPPAPVATNFGENASWIYYWTVVAPGLTADEQALLICTLNDVKPAHTNILFDFT